MTESAKALALYLIALGLVVNGALWYPDYLGWKERSRVLLLVERHLNEVEALRAH